MQISEEEGIYVFFSWLRGGDEIPGDESGGLASASVARHRGAYLGRKIATERRGAAVAEGVEKTSKRLGVLYKMGMEVIKNIYLELIFVNNELLVFVLLTEYTCIGWN